MQTTISLLPTSGLRDAVEVRQHITEAERLIALKQTETAAVILWTAFESAVRLSLAELGEQTDRPIWLSDTRRGLTSQAVVYGVIDPEDKDVLMQFLQACDESAAGNAETIDINLLQKVRWFIERTLGEMGQP